MEKSKFDKNRLRVKHCPCGKNNRDGKFVPIKGENSFGYCHSCGESFFPKTDHSNFRNQHVGQVLQVERPEQSPSFIDCSYVKASQKRFSENAFYIFLKEMFGAKVASDLFKTYKVGTASHYQGATVFWQIDMQGRARAGKIMAYDSVTGKRVKEPKALMNWAHSVLKLKDFNLHQCLFGEHLLEGKSVDIPVALVESEKTAIIASHFFPDHIWLATGGKTNLKSTLFEQIRGRSVKLFPDGGEFSFWENKVDKLQKQFPDIQFYVSDILERHVSKLELSEGFDIADYLIAEKQCVFYLSSPLNDWTTIKV